MAGVEDRAVERAVRVAKERARDDVHLLVAAGRKLLHRDGAADMTIADVLTEAGLSTRAFYRHFASKSDLLLAIYDHEVDRYRPRLQRRLDAATTAREGLVAWIDELLAAGFEPRRGERTRAMFTWARCQAAGAGGRAVIARMESGPVAKSNRFRVLGEGGTGEPADLPLAHAARAERFVEVDRGLVPVEHAPLHPAAAPLVGEAGEVQEQRLAQTAATKLGLHKQILQVEARPGEESGIVEEINRKACGYAGAVSQDAMCRRGVAGGREKRAGEFRLVGLDLVRKLFVRGESPDEIEDQGDISGLGRPDRGGHAPSEADPAAQGEPDCAIHRRPGPAVLFLLRTS